MWESPTHWPPGSGRPLRRSSPPTHRSAGSSDEDLRSASAIVTAAEPTWATFPARASKSRCRACERSSAPVEVRTDAGVRDAAERKCAGLCRNGARAGHPIGVMRRRRRRGRLSGRPIAGRWRRAAGLVAELKETVMSEPFKGKINVDIRDSVPDWSPFEPPKAPEGAPNVVYVVLDDVGFSAMGCYGGPIETPNIDRIAGDGRALHAVAYDGVVLADALVSADRAQPHAQRHGVHHRGASGFPNANGVIPPENGQIQEILGDAGLEHVHGRQVASVPGGRDEPRLVAAQLADGPGLRALLRVPRRRDQPVVSRSWSTTATPSIRRARPRRATTSAWTSPTRRWSSSRTPRCWRPRSRSSSTTRPGACHAPHHAPKEWIDRFKGRFDMGYEAMREQTLARQKELGIVPPDTELPPINPIGTPETRTRARTASRSRRWTYTRPVGLAVGGGAAAVQPHGRGLRRLPGAHRRRRSGGCWTTWRRPASARTRW